MQVVPLERFWPTARSFCVALGYFDGIHLGHQAILRQAVACGERSLLFTFRNHPLSVLRPEQAPQLLTPFEEKVPLVAAQGVQWLVWREFDVPFSRMTPRQFVHQVLAARLGARRVVVGPNYRFGHRAAGSPDMLVELGRECGLEVDVVPPVFLGETMVSSSRIRTLLGEGDVRCAGALLGRPYEVGGTVARGEQRGTRIGFPTANVAVDEARLLPANGVYATRVAVGERTVAGVANLGVRPTFAGHADRRVLEVHLLDFTDDLYDQALHVQFVDRLREERTFAGVDALVEQIRRDVEAARHVLAETPSTA